MSEIMNSVVDRDPGEDEFHQNSKNSLFEIEVRKNFRLCTITG